MTFDLDLGIKLATFAISVTAMIYAFFVNRRKDVDRRFADGSDRMDRHEKRISTIEQTVQTMPVKDDMHALQLELVKQTGSLNEMRAVMEGNAKIMARLEAIVSRHEDHLLDGGMNK